DGSTDGTASVCRDFAEKDPRFLYFYKENGGAASARNVGIQKASGDYITFIDSDDYVDQEYLETLSLPLQECPYTLVQCGMTPHRGGGTTCLLPEKQTLSGSSYKELILKRQIPIFLFQTPTSKLYDRRFILDNHLLFDESITISEDCLFNTEFLQQTIQNVCMIPYAGYHYIQDNSTLTRSAMTFDRTTQSIQVGCRTIAIRQQLISSLKLENDNDVQKGFSTAVCIIYLSNAQLIETGGFSKKEKAVLYDMYLPKMSYPIMPAVNEYTGTDKKIIVASSQSNHRLIARIYTLRRLKKQIFQR
ncbi:MAG: glycosyltransferase family 2 protein, partial [Clostridia bacterium]|nr:glycosyltransferase family 2 protein [Clostridia bacterium]